MDNWTLKAVISAVDKMSPVLKGIGKNLRSTRKHLIDVGNSASGLAGKVGLPLGLLSSVAAGFTLVGVKNQVESLTESAEQLVNSALRAGTSVGNFQRVAFVAGQSGVEADALQAAIGKLNKNLAAAATGKNKNLASLLDKLHISMRDSNGQLRSGVDLLPQISDAFVRNNNAVVRAGMGTAFFSKGYEELLPVLVEGSDKLQDTLNVYKSLNAEMSVTDLEQAKELGDQFRILGVATTSLKNTVLLQLIPTIRPLIDDLVKWLVANKGIIATQLSQFVKDTVNAIKGFDWKGFAADARSLWQNFQWLVEKVGGAKNALILFAVVANAQTIFAILGLMGSISRLTFAVLPALAQAIGFVARAFLLNPIGLAITAIAVGAFLIYKNWDTLKKWFVGFFNWMGDKWQTFLGWIHAAVDAVGGIFGSTAPPSGNAAPGGSVVGGRRSLLTPAGPAQRLNGEMVMRFENAPPGFRVEAAKTNQPGMDINPAVGYRTGFAGAGGVW